MACSQKTPNIVINPYSSHTDIMWSFTIAQHIDAFSHCTQLLTTGQRRWAETETQSEGLGGHWGQKAISAATLLCALCRSPIALAYRMWRYPPQQNVLHCAFEQRLSLCHWRTANFPCCECAGSGVSWSGFFVLREILVYTRSILLWGEHRWERWYILTLLMVVWSSSDPMVYWNEELLNLWTFFI